MENREIPPFIPKNIKTGGEPHDIEVYLEEEKNKKKKIFYDVYDVLYKQFIQSKEKNDSKSHIHHRNDKSDELQTLAINKFLFDIGKAGYPYVCQDIYDHDDYFLYKEIIITMY